MDRHLSCVDAVSGEVTYRRLKLGVILMAEAIKDLPGKRIGVMMPACVAVNVVVLAVQLARKVPVMINWTLGARNLRAVLEASGIQKTISAWNFLNRLENIDLDGIDEQIVLLEDMYRHLSYKDKLKAFWRLKKSPKWLLKHFGVDQVKGSDHAVILFTSGTESLPKGVPLSHSNLLINQRDAFNSVFVQDEDVFLGVLPPFHSFGFSVTNLFPILSGLRVAFSPNPTDGRRMALSVNQWKVTILCIAPTFLKNFLRVATPEQVQTLRLVVSGAEKAPMEIYERMALLNSEAIVIEGYGITECAPILTLNPPHLPKKGVGMPLQSVELLIVHPETHQVLPNNKEGLILARGLNIFHGYLDPHLRSPFIEVGGKMWYQTGDLGYLDEQDCLTLSGRLKRFIKIGGEMVSLSAIEEVLLQVSGKKGWKMESETPSLAICAIEEGGKKGEIHLFTIFSTTPEEVNKELKASGMSNLIRVSHVHKLPFIPLLGTGKIDYCTLATRLKESLQK